jgi:hypothetical protein
VPWTQAAAFLVLSHEACHALFEREHEWLGFLNDRNVVIFAKEDVEPNFLLDLSYLPAESRWVDVKSFRRFPEVQLARNSENILELSEWRSTSHEFTIRNELVRTVSQV